MAEMDWTRPLPAPQRHPLPAWLQHILDQYLDWEDLVTVALLLGATLSVSVTLEAGGWSQQMPALTLVSVLAIFAALLLSRSHLHMLLAWPASILAGAAVIFWQALVMVGPGSLEQRLDNLYFRLDAWFYAAFHAGVSNDSLPFHILVLGITWLGVFLFAWSVFRWHNAWIGLIPGGIALFLDLAFVGDSLSGAALLYYLFGFLLIMRTNLLARMARWRAENVPYPPLISFTFLNFSFWALLTLIIAAWIVPAGPFSTPGIVRSAVLQVEEVGVDFVRLAGPLRSNKIVPIHNYTEVLPFQGSVHLGEREVLTVQVDDPALQGPYALRGAVYDTYESGGWRANDRQTVQLPAAVAARLNQELESDQIDGAMVPLRIQMEAKSVAGTVLFSVGQPLASDPVVSAYVPEGSLEQIPVQLPSGGRHLSDEQILQEHLPDYLIGIRVQRSVSGRVQYVEALDSRTLPALDTVVLRPDARIRKGSSYEVTSFVRTATPEQLRQTDRNYPAWVRNQYAQLPADLPRRVAEQAHTVATEILRNQGKLPVRPSRTGPVPDLRAVPVYDIVKAIETYLREFPIDHDVPDTPPGRDTVDYFLFEARRGYFDYHASAMAVMLRTLDIPARLAVGYVAEEGDFDPDRKAYVIRDKNTYAWTEVYFPGYGWVIFNPTPDRPADLYPGQRQTGLPTGPVDLSQFPDLPVGADPIFGLTDDPFKIRENTRAPSPTPASGSSYTSILVFAVAAFAVLMAAALGLGWRRAMAGLPYEQQTWEKLLRLSSLAGHPLQTGQTPAEFAAALQRRFRGMRGAPLLAQAYARSRFGRRPAGPDERTPVAQVWPDVRRALLKAILTRVLRRGNTAPPDYPY